MSADAPRWRTVGVLGGMGPEATSLFYKLVVREVQRRFSAYLDEDFPEMVLHSLPIPDVTRGLAEAGEVGRRLERSVQLLAQAGASFVAPTCNTIEAYLPDVRRRSAVPILSVVEETARVVRARGAETLVLLATPTTIAEGLYERHLRGVTILAPRDQERVTTLIMNALRGRTEGEPLSELVDGEKDRADLVVLGCTDLSLMAEGWEHDEVVDSLVALARAAVVRAER